MKFCLHTASTSIAFFYLFCQLPLLWALLFFTVMCFHLHHHLQTSLTLSFCNSLLPLSSCRPTKTQTEASVSAVFLARLEDPPHNQTGAKLILPSHNPDWSSLGCVKTDKHKILHLIHLDHLLLRAVSLSQYSQQRGQIKTNYVGPRIKIDNEYWHYILYRVS